MKIVNFPEPMAKELIAMMESQNVPVPDDVTIELLRDLRDDCRHSAWYGGETVAVYRNGRKLVLSARGDICVTMIDIPTGRHLFRVNDRANTGELGSILPLYIRNDQDLQAIIDGKHPDYRLNVESNNWWEFELWVPNGNDYDFVDIGCCSNSDDLFHSILEAVEPTFDWWYMDV